MCEKIILKKIPNKVFIAILICTITFMLGIALNIRFLLMIGLFGTFFYSIFYLRKESYLAVAFLISFFTFLLGRIFINAISAEAVSLVLQAGAYAKGGEIFILDMGKPVKIADMARNLIKLSGYEPDIDIKIEYTGLRPGEKLYEELLMKEEGLQDTPNHLIHIGKPIEMDEEVFLEKLVYLKKEAYEETNDIRHLIKDIVPTYQPKA